MTSPVFPVSPEPEEGRDDWQPGMIGIAPGGNITICWRNFMGDLRLQEFPTQGGSNGYGIGDAGEGPPQLRYLRVIYPDKAQRDDRIACLTAERDDRERAVSDLYVQLVDAQNEGNRLQNERNKSRESLARVTAERDEAQRQVEHWIDQARRFEQFAWDNARPVPEPEQAGELCPECGGTPGHTQYTCSACYEVAAAAIASWPLAGSVAVPANALDLLLDRACGDRLIDSPLKGADQPSVAREANLRGPGVDAGDQFVVDADGYLFHDGKVSHLTSDIGSDIISGMTTKLMNQVVPGDVVVLSLPAGDFSCTVERIEDTGSKAMGSTTRRILRLVFSDAPRIVKGLEKVEDAPIETVVFEYRVMMEHFDGTVIEHQSGLTEESATRVMRRCPSDRKFWTERRLIPAWERTGCSHEHVEQVDSTSAGEMVTECLRCGVVQS